MKGLATIFFRNCLPTKIHKTVCPQNVISAKRIDLDVFSNKTVCLQNVTFTKRSVSKRLFQQNGLISLFFKQNRLPPKCYFQNSLPPKCYFHKTVCPQHDVSTKRFDLIFCSKMVCLQKGAFTKRGVPKKSFHQNFNKSCSNNFDNGRTG